MLATGFTGRTMQREDAIADLQRLCRQKQPALAALVRLARFPASRRSPAWFHFVRNGLAEIAERYRGRLYTLGGKRLLLLLEERPTDIGRWLAALFEVEQGGGTIVGRLPQPCELFSLPEGYVELRERLEEVGDGMEEAAPIMATGPFSEEASGRPSDASSGSLGLAGALDAAKLAALLPLLDGLELAPFLRRQPVWQLGPQPKPLYVELYTDLAEIARAHFPRLGLAEGTPLYHELRRHLDRLLLTQLLLDRSLGQTPLGINLSAAVLATPEFGWFRDRVRRFRLDVTVELDWSELLVDLCAGAPLQRQLKEAGFRVAADGLAPAVLDLVSPRVFDVSIVKLAFGDADPDRFLDPELGRRLATLPAATVVLTRCDRREALAAALRLGIRHVQGWLVDRLVRQHAAEIRETAA